MTVFNKFAMAATWILAVLFPSGANAQNTILPDDALTTEIINQCIAIEGKLLAESVGIDDNEKLRKLYLSSTYQISALISGKEIQFRSQPGDFADVIRVRVGEFDDVVVVDVLISVKQSFSNQPDEIPLKVEMLDHDGIYIGDMKFDVHKCSARWGGNFVSGTNATLGFGVPLLKLRSMGSLLVRPVPRGS